MDSPKARKQLQIATQKLPDNPPWQQTSTNHSENAVAPTSTIVMVAPEKPCPTHFKLHHKSATQKPETSKHSHAHKRSLGEEKCGPSIPYEPGNIALEIEDDVQRAYEADDEYE